MTHSELHRIAIIPARGGSKRFPRKNISQLCGRALIEFPIETAKLSEVFSKVIVSTEDSEIASIARNAGAEVFSRNREYATDTAHELQACRELLVQWQGSKELLPAAFCVIYPTAVLITPEDLRRSAALIGPPHKNDVVMSVSDFNYHPYKSLRTDAQGYLSMEFPVECQRRSQEYPEFVASNGTFYWLKTTPFLESDKHSYYYSPRLAAHKIDSGRAVDINYPADLVWAELLMNAKQRNQP